MGPVLSQLVSLFWIAWNALAGDTLDAEFFLAVLAPLERSNFVVFLHCKGSQTLFRRYPVFPGSQEVRGFLVLTRRFARGVLEPPASTKRLAKLSGSIRIQWIGT